MSTQKTSQKTKYRIREIYDSLSKEGKTDVLIQLAQKRIPAQTFREYMRIGTNSPKSIPEEKFFAIAECLGVEAINLKRN